jgi:hypothetical protein
LELTNCTKITIIGLIAVAKKCLNLEELDCNYDSGFSNENVTISNLDEIIESI